MVHRLDVRHRVTPALRSCASPRDSPRCVVRCAQATCQPAGVFSPGHVLGPTRLPVRRRLRPTSSDDMDAGSILGYSRRPERGRAKHCRNSATDAGVMERPVAHSAGLTRPKLRQRFRLLVPAYVLTNNPLYRDPWETRIYSATPR